MTLRVECYSGWKAEERPGRFEIDGLSTSQKKCLIGGTAQMRPS